MSLHRLAASFVLAYHGCDEAVARRLVDGEPFRPSDNDYDWLGPGIYFWEANPQRGLDFARELQGLDRAAIERPAVVGAVIDLGLCLDLTTAIGIAQVHNAYKQASLLAAAADDPLPENSADLRRRNRDCAVLRVLHGIRENAGEPPIDTVRGIFVEGGPIYPTSGIREKTHVQICVCQPDCIKGVFRVPERFHGA